MAAPTIHARSVLRQMDHYILALRAGGSGDAPDVLVSLFWIGYTTELGAPTCGHVAYAWAAGGLPGREGGPARVLTDAPALVERLGDRLRPRRWALVERWPDSVPATFERRMTDPLGFAWRIEAPDGWRLDARWEGLGTPVFSTGATRDGSAVITTLLVASSQPSVAVSGVPLPGEPYPDPIWTPWFGSEQGSCVIGLGETIYRPAGAAGAAGQ